MAVGSCHLDQINGVCECMTVWKTAMQTWTCAQCFPANAYIPNSLHTFLPTYLPTYISAYSHTHVHWFTHTTHSIPSQTYCTRVGWARASITQQQRRPALHWLLVTSWKLTQQSKQKSWLVFLFATSKMVYIKDSGEEALITFWNYILYNSKLPMNSLHAVLH